MGGSWYGSTTATRSPYFSAEVFQISGTDLHSLIDKPSAFGGSNALSRIGEHLLLLGCCSSTYTNQIRSKYYQRTSNSRFQELASRIVGRWSGEDREAKLRERIGRQSLHRSRRRGRRQWLSRAQRGGLGEKMRDIGAIEREWRKKREEAEGIAGKF